MDLRPARLDASDVALTTGIIAGAVTLASGPDAPLPEWIKVTPAGRASTRDGRSFTFDPARLAARFADDGIDLAVDTDHSVAILASKGEKPNVVGWVKAVEARQDGTYGRVEWDDPAEARRTLKSHRYVSPTIHHDATGAVTWLHTVALVSAPALGNMPALAHASPHQDPPMKEIAKALGLAETADEAACLAALRGVTARRPLLAALGLPEDADTAALLSAVTTLRVSGANGAAGDKAMIATLQADLTATNGRLADVIRVGRDREVGELFDGAMRDRRMVPAEKDSLSKLCATDEGLTHVRALLASRVPGLGASGLDGLAAPGGDGAVDPVQLAAKGRALVDKGEFPDIVAAINHLTKKKG